MCTKVHVMLKRSSNKYIGLPYDTIDLYIVYPFNEVDLKLFTNNHSNLQHHYLLVKLTRDIG